MTIKILTEKSNPLFGRKEITADLESTIAPSRSHVSELISKKFSTPQENVKIKSIHGKFGTQRFTITANVYSSKMAKDSIELKKKKDSKEKKE